VAWTTPLTAVSNATLTAAQWNATVRDDLLETAPAKATAAGRIFVSTGANALAERVIDSTTTAASSTTTSVTYAGLAAGTGPAVTVTTGVRALVFGCAFISSNSIGQKSWISVAVTGASAITASDTIGHEFQVYGSNAEHRGTFATLFKTLTAGSNTFTMQYRVSAGTSTYQDRELTVIAL
jgi:hypothetical protein